MLAELAILLLTLFVFQRVHAATGTDAAVATANARALQAVESALHLDIVPGMNRWLVEHPALVKPAVYYYRLYYAVVLGVLVWVFVRHAEVYRHVRRTLVAMCLLVLPVYWAVPMSPPRFALPGVVDVIAANDILGAHVSKEITAGQNVYSAMPSMHTAWSLWCAYAAWSALRVGNPRWALLPWLFPAGMIAVVFATGNHYVLDVAGSFVLLGLAVAVAAAWGSLSARRRGERPRAGRPLSP
ncbi:hypothetical protein Sru01_44880 [Sphaerisporangium rufum]|uniref:Inositolphosphotransferase Aur1/Ipt1 domain-containing protein n=1 Tax=Sphaerisporangium rufum TaxID=1381558 RepID=A0A919R4F3_9ACTN|nr:hypothetical protein Sru01_44880 [Sphaerisporangium rufum]